MDRHRPWYRELLMSEDWWSIWLGAVQIAVVLILPTALSTTYLGKDSIVGPACLLALLSAIAVRSAQREAGLFVAAFSAIFFLAWVANGLAGLKALKDWNLEYALWALLIGLAISNSIAAPAWLRKGARSELYIKTGLVLLGAEVLASQIRRVGGPAMCVAWLVTPVVVVFMYWFGRRVLRIGSASLTMVVACSTSVCGVSAAIAVAAACRAKQQELMVAVGMTMIFTVAMMVGMPVVCGMLGLDEDVAGAWIGGTVDSTGAVAAAGAMVGPVAERVAAVVKMMQNMLIGLIAFLISIYWVTAFGEVSSSSGTKISEIWRRFPKFVIGFFAASLFFSFVLQPLMEPQRFSDTTGVLKSLRGWWFCLAFVAIGLESDLREFAAQLVGGKPIWLYIVGQSFNLLLTLAVAQWVFGG